MNRRDFLSTSIAGLAMSSFCSGSTHNSIRVTEPGSEIQFAISYDTCVAAGHASHSDASYSDAFYSVVEDYGFCSRPEEQRRAITDYLLENNRRFGLFAGSVNYGEPFFSSGRSLDQQVVYRQINQAVNVTGGVSGKWCSIIPGKKMFGLSWKRQAANSIEFLKNLSDYADKKNMILLIEPVNYLDKDSEMFLSDIIQAYEICEKVNHPSCKILYDVRQQLILNRDIQKDVIQFGSHIGYFQFENSHHLYEESVFTQNSQKILNTIVSSNQNQSIVIGNY